MENNEKMIFGVCAKVAKRFGLNVTAVRIIWAILAFFYGSGVLAYLIAAALLHNK